MLYPQITGEPNFILIGVSAVFGLLVIIMVYYIVVSKSRNPSRLYSDNGGNIGNIGNSSNSSNSSNSGSWQPKANPVGYNLNPGITTQNSTSTIPTSSMPVPINTGGYYSAAPVPSATSSGPTQSNSSIKQVFNVKENIYASDDAGGVCGALGADVASLQQLVDAHRLGANWCNVGWTKDGLAAYPVQKEFWQKMQGNDPQNRNICGQPGINMARSDDGLLYGVNCYGVKPEPKNGELIKEVVQNDADIALQAKIALFQKTVNNMSLAPFNANQWSE